MITLFGYGRRALINIVDFHHYVGSFENILAAMPPASHSMHISPCFPFFPCNFSVVRFHIKRDAHLKSKRKPIIARDRGERKKNSRPKKLCQYQEIMQDSCEAHLSNNLKNDYKTSTVMKNRFECMLENGMLFIYAVCVRHVSVHEHKLLGRQCVYLLWNGKHTSENLIQAGKNVVCSIVLALKLHVSSELPATMEINAIHHIKITDWCLYVGSGVFYFVCAAIDLFQYGFWFHYMHFKWCHPVEVFRRAMQWCTAQH